MEIPFSLPGNPQANGLLCILSGVSPAQICRQKGGNGGLMGWLARDRPRRGCGLDLSNEQFAAAVREYLSISFS
jgi:hypothetical protein